MLVESFNIELWDKLLSLNSYTILELIINIY
jgi:hypothetical protein